MSNRGSVVILAIMFSGLLAAQAVSPAEQQRFEEIKARHDRGEAVSADDRQFAQSVMERMQQTVAALKTFQKQHKLKVTGKLDHATAKALGV